MQYHEELMPLVDNQAQSKNTKRLLLTAGTLLFGVLCFGIGRLSKIEEAKLPLTIESIEKSASAVTPTSNTSALIKSLPPDSVSRVVASKNGTKYYYTNCAGASRISEVNKIYYDSVSLAEASGKSLAANCKSQ